MYREKENMANNIEENDDTDLDISWIEEQEKIQKIDKNYFREPMETIDVHIIYININSYIENIKREKHTLNTKDKNTVLEKERILQIIQSKKRTTPFSKYKFMDALLYNVDLEPEQIQNYANTEDIEQTPFFKPVRIMEDIIITPSIFVFHGINALYLFFKEEARTDISTVKNKSILKTDGQPIAPHKTTKKVKIVIRANQSTTKRQKPIKNNDP
jgi:hypothetical protein